MTETYVNTQNLLGYMTGVARLCANKFELQRELEYYLKHLPADAKLEKENTSREKN